MHELLPVYDYQSFRSGQFNADSRACTHTSILHVGGIHAAEKVVSQFDHIRLQRVGEGEGKEEGV